MQHDDPGVESGQVIAGKYRLVKILGRGGMGSVWRADHLSLLSPVAVKVIKQQIAGNKNSVARFMREAKAAAMLRSPHVVQILDHGSDGAIAFICMELLEGDSLLVRLKRDGKLSPELTATVMTHVARAMAKAHETGIVHRDLKPDNVFLVHNDDEIIAKVLDFGIAKSSLFALNQSESPQTQTGALLGTPYYMSPEQATGSKHVDHRADLWAMAVITYECIIGRRPFQSDSLGDLVLRICSKPKPVPSQHGAVPPGFDAWFDRATAREPDGRFASAKEQSRALREVLRHPAEPMKPAPAHQAPKHGPPISPYTLDAAHADRHADTAPTHPSVPPPPGLQPAAQPSTPQPSIPQPSVPHASHPGAIDAGVEASYPNLAAPSQPSAAGVEASHPHLSAPVASEPGAAAVQASHPGRSGPLATVDAPPNLAGLDTESNGDLGLGTLDPLAATTSPRSRGWLWGALGGALAVLLLGAAGYALMGRDGEPRDASPNSAASGREPTSGAASTTAPAAEPPSPAHTAQIEILPEEDTQRGHSAASASAAVSGMAPPTPPQARTARPPAPAPPVRPPPRRQPPAGEEDPLGI
jgi:serine/threonine-protein kinase